MITYAIRDVRDGFYMPAHQPSKMSGSYSWDEPRCNGGRWGPRLFNSEQSAMNSLTAWLQGRWGGKYLSYHGNWGQVEEYVLSVARQNNRHRKNMEIVKFSLREISRKV